MLREYQRELNDSVWPGGITLHQEAHFLYNTPPISSQTHLSARKITTLSI